MRRRLRTEIVPLLLRQRTATSSKLILPCRTRTPTNAFSTDLVIDHPTASEREREGEGERGRGSRREGEGVGERRRGRGRGRGRGREGRGER
jgi:hypothetical protein